MGLERERDGDWFDEEAAERAVAFFGFLRHTKGKWAGEAFELLPWQRDGIVRPLFGWKRADGTRRYRHAYIEIPRKNGKSTLASGLALYLLFADGEPSAEVYSAAADKEQARIVFEQAKAMVEEAPALLKRARIYKHSMVLPKTRSSYKVLSADAYTKHGLNASGIVIDELHAQPDRELFDVLDTSTGARRQPLVVMITTAGYDRESVCWEQHEYARQVAEGVIEDPSWFVFIAAAEERDDWTAVEVWRKANPGFGETVSEDYLREQCLKARQSPAYENTFRRLHLNQWTSQESRWLPLASWDACGAVGLPDLRGRVCYGGLDLASTTDLAALALVFPPEVEGEPYWLLPVFWAPAENLEERGRRNGAPYEAWRRQGYLLATEGNVIDYGAILGEIRRLGERYRLREIAYDPWNATHLAQELEGAGFVMVQTRQGFGSLSAPTKELERLVLGGRLGHGGHPVLRWMADNVAVVQDAAGNLKPDKKKSKKKIDGIVAAIMGLDRAVRTAAAESVYETRDVLEI